METAGTIIINGIIDGQDGQDGKDAAEVILTPGTIYFAGDDGKYVDDTQYVQVTVGMKVDGTACTISSIAVGTVPSGVSYTRNGTTLTFHNTASDYGDIEGSVSIVVTGTITSGGVTTTYTATGVLPIVCTQAGASVTSVDKYFKAISTNSAPAYDNTWTKNATPSYWSVYIRYLWCREYTNFSDGSGSWGSIYLHSVWGQQGTNGDTGPMCYIAGTYRDDIEYTSSAKQTVAVEVETGSNTTEIYYLVAESNVDANGNHIPPKNADGSVNSTVWAQGLNRYNLIRTQYLFADFAKLGSGIVSGDWVFSQYGTLIDKDGNETVIDGSNANTLFTGYTDVVLNGNGVNSGIIVCKCSFTVSSATNIAIRLTPSSESGCDYGAVGNIDSPSLGAATQSSILQGTDCLLYSSGTAATSTVVVGVSAGTHYFYVAYAKDGSVNANGDNATIAFDGITLSSVTVVKQSTGTTYTSNVKSYVPYGWTDASDIQVETLPVVGYKFRPNAAKDLLTGMIVGAGGKFTVSPDGSVKANNFFRNVCLVTDAGHYSENGVYKGGKTDTGDAELVLLISRNNAAWSYNSADGYGMVYIPKPSDYPGKTIEIRHTLTPADSVAAHIAAADQSQVFVRGFYFSTSSQKFTYSNPTSEPLLNYGQTMQLVSVYADDKWVWMYSFL